MSKVDIPSTWQELIVSIRHKKGAVMLLGGADTGKTFLSHYLIRQLVSAKCRSASGGKNGIVTALVDGDIGQSTIGPPTTIGIAIFKEVPRDFEKIKPSFMRFVGSTSPVGHLLQTLTGVKKMVDKAIQSGAEVVVVDTTGFVSGDIARELKFQKIDLVKPRHIVALTREDELEDILRPYSGKKDILLHRIKPAKGVRTKTQVEREKNRERKFHCYFKDAIIKGLSIEKFGIHGMIPKFTEEKFKNLLIAFCDRSQDVLALGIIEEFHARVGRIEVRTPLRSMESVSSIQFGTLAIKSSGEQVQFRR